jgi:hypothetical protein
LLCELLELLLWPEEADAPWADELGAVWVDGVAAACMDGAGENVPRVGGVGFEAPLSAVVGVVLEAGFGAVFAELLSELVDEKISPICTLAKKTLAARLHLGMALTILNSGSDGEPRATIF